MPGGLDIAEHGIDSWSRMGLWLCPSRVPFPSRTALHDTLCPRAGLSYVRRHALHNPWAWSAREPDCWDCLAVCESETVLEPLRQLLGKHIVLFESRLGASMAAPASSSQFFREGEVWPVAPLSGATAMLVLEQQWFHYIPGSHRDSELVATGSRQLRLRPGDLLFYHPALLQFSEQRSAESGSSVSDYRIQYFPADALFVRDPVHQAHQILAERWPLLNYCRYPLWLVSGTDLAGNNYAIGYGIQPGAWTDATMPFAD
ncbi:MAG: hypothetical protein RJQ10_06265 [Haliea sp.]|uniref:hypothetical protein n=1 Tax=Haliea sp. TaxID=1932666 RepID=UPI0032EB6E56